LAGTAFRFKFQKILHVREKQQQALEIELARMDTLVREKEAALQRWHATRRETIDDRRRARLKGDLDLESRYGDYLTYVGMRTRQCQSELLRLREEREATRRELERLAQACKVLENYRDRLRRQFLTEAERAEERVLDLSAIHRFIQAEDVMRP
jgi:flagellar export protein FliJ